ncbi:MAG: FxsA family protein [Beijerinckiaceae bacterium]|nr:MAG: FxsA family protein [Beijerinckiaceae bacterium]
MPVFLGLFAGLGLWFFGELVAFSLVAHAIGLDGAIIATLATSLFGMWFLHRLGASARRNVLDLLNSGGGMRRFAPERFSAGLSAGFGAVLLILPGFLSDCVGLFLILRAARAWRTPQNASAPKSDDVIELSPQDWRHIDEHKPNGH